MSRPDLPTGSRWTPAVGANKPIEEQPYRECPNCARYKFRWAYFPGGLLSSDRAIEMCEECKYRGRER